MFKTNFSGRDKISVGTKEI